MEGEKQEYPEKDVRSRDENQQQTQAMYDIGTGYWTQATLVEGECSHHRAIPAPQNRKTVWSKVACLKKQHNMMYTPDMNHQVFILPHTMCFELYINAFQYKVLNNILNTNMKLHKLGFTADDRCSFCKFEPETWEDLLFYCTYSKRFWKDYESYFHSLTNEFISITLQDMLIGIIASSCP